MTDLRITNPADGGKLVAILTLDEMDRVASAPPSFAAMQGWDLMRLAAHCRREGWTLAPDIEGVTDDVEP